MPGHPVCLFLGARDAYLYLLQGLGSLLSGPLPLLPTPSSMLEKGEEFGKGGRLSEVTGHFSFSLCVSLFFMLLAVPQVGCSESGLEKANIPFGKKEVREPLRREDLGSRVDWRGGCVLSTWLFLSSWPPPVILTSLGHPGAPGHPDFPLFTLPE